MTAGVGNTGNTFGEVKHMFKVAGTMPTIIPIDKDLDTSLVRIETVSSTYKNLLGPPSADNFGSVWSRCTKVYNNGNGEDNLSKSQKQPDTLVNGPKTVGVLNRDSKVIEFSGTSIKKTDGLLSSNDNDNSRENIERRAAEEMLELLINIRRNREVFTNGVEEIFKQAAVPTPRDANISSLGLGKTLNNSVKDKILFFEGVANKNKSGYQIDVPGTRGANISPRELKIPSDNLVKDKITFFEDVNKNKSDKNTLKSGKVVPGTGASSLPEKTGDVPNKKVDLLSQKTRAALNKKAAFHKTPECKNELQKLHEQTGAMSTFKANVRKIINEHEQRANPDFTELLNKGSARLTTA